MRNRIFLKILFMLGVVFITNPVFASTTVGTIDPMYHTALLCKNSDCATSSQVNFKADNNNPQPVFVTDTLLTGDIWAEDMGWIRLNPSGGYGGVINNDGVLSGYAFGDGAGWISFNCENETPNNCSLNNNFKVIINSNGEFSGYAWSQNFGWIKFDCSVANACVKTDWRPASTRSNGFLSSGSIPIINTPILQISIIPNISPTENLPVVSDKPTKNTSNTQTNVPSENNQIDTFVNPTQPENSKNIPANSNEQVNINVNNLTSVTTTQNKNNSILSKVNNNIIRFMNNILGFTQSISKYNLTFKYTLFNTSGYFRLSQVLLFIFGTALVIWLIIFIVKKIHKNKKI